FHTRLVVDAKGKLQPGFPDDPAHFTKLKITMPKKLDKSLPKKTTAGATMVISFTLTGTPIEIMEFLSTEGIAPVPGTIKKGPPQNRELKNTALIGGLPYLGKVLVTYTPDSDFGTVKGRKN